jgi:hypothetical protein
MLSGSRFICAAFISGALFVGCAPNGGNAPAFSGGASSSVRQAKSWMSPEASSGNLLYVSDPGSGAIMVYTYPPGGYKFVGVINGPVQPMGECVDANENLWTTGGVDYESYVLYKYAHGATSPSVVLQDPVGSPVGCSVDRSNGDLAVASMNADGSNLPIAIYKNGAGKPKQYEYQYLYPEFLTYDNKGDLFVIGKYPNDGAISLVELPRGGKNLLPITIGQSVDATGGIAWDGKYLAIADAGAATIYRFAISGSTATEVGSVSVHGAYTIYQLTIDGSHAIVPSNLFGDPGFINIYAYPAGGTRLRTLRNFSAPYAAVVSRAVKSPPPAPIKS